MRINNSKLINPGSNKFLILNTINIHLFNGYLWQSEDINEFTALGSIFHAFEDPPISSVAAITIADITNDPDEPSIELLEDKDVSKIDNKLRDAIESQMEVTTWMKSQLNISNGFKGLVTPYIVKSDEKDWQYIALRMEHLKRKFAIIGMFDIAKKDPLAKLVYTAIQSVSLQH